MPKDTLTEGLVSKFMIKLFTSILKGKQRAILKSVANDPELKRKVQKSIESTEDLKSYLSKRNKKRDKTGRLYPDIDY
tara:strand:- start:6356 stop:6589 length:234 start_codon:yes stop_codon:yes gene_type:complete